MESFEGLNNELKYKQTCVIILLSFQMLKRDLTSPYFSIQARTFSAESRQEISMYSWTHTVT